MRHGDGGSVSWIELWTVVLGKGKRDGSVCGIAFLGACFALGFDGGFRPKFVAQGMTWGGKLPALKQGGGYPKTSERFGVSTRYIRMKHEK